VLAISRSQSFKRACCALRSKRALAIVASGLLVAACTDDKSSSAPSAIASSSTSAPAPGSPAPVGLRVKFTAIIKLEQPVDLRVRPGDNDHLYIAERVGRITSVLGSAKKTILDMTSRTKAEGERGLLGFTFSPDGATLYVDYTDRNGDSNIDSYPMGSNGKAVVGQRRQLLFQKQPYINHNGGNLVFGPDGYLYVGFGDGGLRDDPQNRAQDMGTWLGKILRIDPTRPDHLAPADNPFVGIQGALPEIWSFGLRNPWRYSFDADTGDLWIGDVGQDEVEEVDMSPKGQVGRGVDFGWSRFEGKTLYQSSRTAPNAVEPVFQVTHSQDKACSMTGGFVYRGAAVPALRGLYIFGDLCWTGIRAWSPAGGIVDLGGPMTQVVSFGQDQHNELYVLAFGDNTVYRIDAA
jgi:glucose/arabinose dehydrogenase